jgi:hypothetical protein
VRRIDPDRARAAVVASYQAVTDDASKLDEDELARPSRCLGWSRGDLLFHLLLDAQRALVTFAIPAAAQPDVDFASYWAPFQPGADNYLTHARFTKRVAAAFEATIHHLDLMTGPASGPGLAVTRETLDGILGQPVPADWDDVTYALKATGRTSLTDGDRARLGPLAASFPLLG